MVSIRDQEDLDFFDFKIITLDKVVDSANASKA